MIERYREPVVQEVIDGITYTSTKFPTTEALSLFARLCLVLGEQGLGALVSAGIEDIAGAAEKMRAGMTGRAIVQIAEGISKDPALPLSLCRLLKASRLRPGNTAGGPVADAFDAHFAGEYPHLFRVLLLTLVHNFAGFTLGFHSDSGSPTLVETTEDSPSSSPTPNEGSTQ